MNILVTGASGFIGSYIVEEGLRQGHQVWAGVRKSSSKAYLQDERIRFACLDLSSKARLAEQLYALKAEMGGCGWDVVVHAAGATKCLHAQDFYRTNYDGTVHLVEALREAGMMPARLVYLSSLSVFGAIREQPVRKPTQDNPWVYVFFIVTESTEIYTGKDISVVFEGNEVFFGGLDDTQPDLWFSGTIEGDRLMLKKWQYMGVDRKNTTYALGQPSHMYLYPFGWGYFTDDAGNEKFGLYEVESPSLAYDAATKTFSTDELTLAINRGHHYYPFVYYTKPKFVPASAAGVESIEAEEEGVVTYTDLAGRRVERPTKGVYVRTVRGKDGKVRTDKIVMAR